MAEPTTKAEVEGQLERAWAEVRSAVESVPESEIEAKGIVEDWSAKDLMGHMAFWSNRAAITLRAMSAGRPEDIPQPSGENWLDEWNSREYQARKDKPWRDVRSEWIIAHEEARKALSETQEATLFAPYRTGKLINWFAADTYEHYAEHLEHIKAWLREMETTEK
jgi:hypothetical protein